MKKYTYEIGNSLYINITNKCSNSCTFCVRETSAGIGQDSLWLKEEPTVEEVFSSISNPAKYQEFVFCGFGEPLTRLEAVVRTAKMLRGFQKPIRINTNGQANLIHGRNIVPELKGLIDTISISLNAHDSKSYQEICSSFYGEAAFPAVLDFTVKCKDIIPKVVLSVVNLPGIDIDRCRKIAEDIGVEFRVRHWSPIL